MSDRRSPAQSLPSADGFTRTHANLDHYARFWLHHQKLWGWYGLWDYGDVQHHYKTGTALSFPATSCRVVEDWPKDLAKIDVSPWRRQDYAPDQEWAFDNGRWGWNNTRRAAGPVPAEPLPPHGRSGGVLPCRGDGPRTSGRGHAHDGMWLGLGTRHGVQHWSDGNHEERQTTHSNSVRPLPERRPAQPRLCPAAFSSNVIRAVLSESTRPQRPAQGLLTWWEMTGANDVAAMLAKYVPSFLVAEGICESPNVQFPRSNALPRTGTSTAGTCSSGPSGRARGVGVLLLTGDDRVRQALIRVATARCSSASPATSSRR